MDKRVVRITTEFGISEAYAKAWVAVMDTEVRRAVKAEMELK